MLPAYEIFRPKLDQASPHQVRGPETMGTKQKWWLVNRISGRMVLLKLSRPGTGEDWSEKIACQIAKHLGIPCPTVELAEWEEHSGVLCWDFLGRRHLPGKPARVERSLIHGNELLLERDPKYPIHERFRVSAHTIASVHEVLKGADHMGRSDILDGERGDAFDMFVGYLMLDALIGNTDRHHENWAIVTGPERYKRLAPTYDHASSMGRELSDAKRLARMGESGRGTVHGYISKTTSAFWSDRVPDVRLSVTGKRFTLELLRYNRQAILELGP